MKCFAFSLVILCLVLASGSVGADWWDYGEYNLDSRTIALIHAEENTGTIAYDSTANNYDFTLSNPSMWDSIVKKWGAASLSPQGIYVASNGTLMDVVPAEWTIEMWVSPTHDMVPGATNWDAIFAKENTVNDLIDSVFVYTTGKIQFRLVSGGTEKIVSSTQTSWTGDVWYHLALTYEDGIVCMTVNGVGAECIASENFANGTTDQFYIGADYDGTTNKGVFRVDEFRVSDINRLKPVSSPSIDLNIWKIDDYPVSGQFPSFRYSNDGNLTIDFNVLNLDNSTMTADINYHTSNDQGAGTVLIDDLNLSSLVCTGAQAWSVDDANCSWDFNISGVTDGNYYVLIEITDDTNSIFRSTTKSFKIETQFTTLTIRDENFGYPLVSQTVTFNGIGYTPNYLGKVSLPIGGLNGRYTVMVGEDSNYPTRYFTLDLNSSILSWDLNVFMIQDNNSLDVDFKFYDVDETTILSNKKVYVLHDGNFAGIRYTDGSGEVSFVVDPDDNYVFDVVKSGTNVQRFHPAKLTIQIPKDESTLANISPFDADGRQLAMASWHVQAAAITSYILPNTVGYYVFDINAGASYYSRAYSVSVKGDTASYSLQPYLTAVGATVSGNYVFSVKESSTNSPIPAVTIRVTKIVPGEGEQEIASVVSDATGTATISLQFGVEYTFYFYYNGELLSTDSPVVPSASSASFLKHLSIAGAGPGDVEVGQLGVFCYPINGTLFLNDYGWADINVGVNFSGKTFYSMVVSLIDSNGVVWDYNTFSGVWQDGNFVHYDLNLFDFNFDRQLRVGVVVTSTDGNTYTGYCSFSVFEADQWALPNMLADLRDKAGVGVTSFIAVFITLLAVGGLTMTNLVPGDPLLLTMLALFILFGFVAIGFLDLIPVVFVALFVVFFAILTRAVI